MGMRKHMLMIQTDARTAEIASGKRSEEFVVAQNQIRIEFFDDPGKPSHNGVFSASATGKARCPTVARKSTRLFLYLVGQHLQIHHIVTFQTQISYSSASGKQKLMPRHVLGNGQRTAQMAPGIPHDPVKDACHAQLQSG